MKLTVEEIARRIDVSAVRAPHGKKELDELAAAARENGFIAVHALPGWIPYLKKITEGSGVLIGGPVGFPGGGHAKETKVLEAKGLVRDGVDEMDMMMNIGRLLSGDYDYVLDECVAVIGAVGDVPVKVIIEAFYLSDDDIKRACDICIRAGAAFVKTGTGWAAGGATTEQIELITRFAGNAIRVKAAGGVRGLSMFVKLFRMGVSRFGINLQSSLDILSEARDLPGGVEIDGM